MFRLVKVIEVLDWYSSKLSISKLVSWYLEQME